ncbi:ankyrin repeat-containing domain protein, partial [Baffinella frigidus]
MVEFVTLWEACTHDLFDETRQLLRQGVCVEHRGGKYKSTPLIAAAQNGNHHIVSLLLDAKADMSAMDTCGMTAMHTATLHNKVSVVRTLLRHGDDVN